MLVDRSFGPNPVPALRKEDALIEKHTNHAPTLILPACRLRHSNEVAAVGQALPRNDKFWFTFSKIILSFHTRLSFHSTTKPPNQPHTPAICHTLPGRDGVMNPNSTSGPDEAIPSGQRQTVPQFKDCNNQQYAKHIKKKYNTVFMILRQFLMHPRIHGLHQWIPFRLRTAEGNFSCCQSALKAKFRP